VRGHGLSVSWTYPALLAPFAWSYGAMKAVNAVVIVLTAVPVFLWARRLASPLSALAAAALTLLLPSMLFSSTLMLENLFLPLFVTACFLCALALERPALAWQAAALGGIALASATRVEGLVLVPVFAAAALTVRRARALAPALAVCAAVALAVLVKLAAGGLGVYEAHREAEYSAGGILAWLVRSAGELSLAAGIVPVAALLALRPRSERERVFRAVAVWATAALVCLAAVGASWQPHGIKERYMVHAVPLLLIALVVWVERPARRPWWAVVVPAALAVALPLGRLFREPSLLGNGWGLLPFERAGLTAVRILVPIGAVAAVACFLWAPRLALAGVAVFLAVSTAVVYATIRDQSRATLARSGLTDRRWLDRAADGPVTYLNTTAFEQETREGRWLDQWLPVWETEFWNRRLDGVLTLAGALEPAPFFQRHAQLDWSDGRIAGGEAGLVLADPRFVPAGRRLASNGRLLLYRASAPLRLASAVEGVHADGTTTGLAAFSRWTGEGRVVVDTSAPGRLAAGSFAAVPGGGGRIARTDLARRVDGVTTFRAPKAPFRVEVRARPGTRVKFGFLPA
jgi:hypothetical protein